MLQYGVQYAEVIALIFSILYLNKYIANTARWIPVYLLVVVIVEFIGEKLLHNQWIYNILGAFELVVFAYIFITTVRESSLKRIILLSFWVGLTALAADGIFITQSFKIFLSNGFAFVSMAMATMGIVFLLAMAKSERVIFQSKILLYWVVLGLLFFHLCNLPVTVFANELIEIGNVNNILIIQSIAAITMYGCFTIGFVWSRKEYNY